MAAELADESPDVAVELLMYATASAWYAADAGPVADIAAAIDAIAEDDLSPTSRALADAVRGFVATSRATPPARHPRCAGRSRGAGSRTTRATCCGRRAPPSGSAIPAAFEDLLVRAAELARPRGELASLAEALGILSIHRAVFAQRYDEAAVAAEEAAALSRELGAENLEAMAAAPHRR